MTMNPNDRIETIDLLVAESDPSEAERIREWLDPMLNRTHVFTNAENARAFLLGEPPYESERRTPGLVILDTGLMGDECWELIDRLRGRPEYERVVVVALSSSRSWKEVERSRRAGADMVMPRPASLTNLAELAARVEDMGVAVVRRRPSDGDGA